LVRIGCASGGRRLGRWRHGQGDTKLKSGWQPMRQGGVISRKCCGANGSAFDALLGPAHAAHCQLDQSHSSPRKLANDSDWPTPRTRARTNQVEHTLSSCPGCPWIVLTSPLYLTLLRWPENSPAGGSNAALF